MLAQFSTPDAVTLAGFLGCLFFLVAGTNQLLRLVDRMKEKPPPAETYVSKAFCSQIHRSQEDSMRKLVHDVEALQANRDQARELVNVSIDRLRSEMNESLRRVHNRIDDLPGQVVALLKNTGALE